MTECNFKVSPYNGLQRAEQTAVEYVVYVDDGITLEHLLQPSTWQHVANTLNPWDRIEVRWDDFSKYANFLVCDISSGGVLLFHEGTTEIKTGSQSLSQDTVYEVAYRGRAQWSVIRKEDKHVMQQGLSSKEHANAAMSALIKNAGL